MKIELYGMNRGGRFNAVQTVSNKKVGFKARLFLFAAYGDLPATWVRVGSHGISN